MARDGTMVLENLLRERGKLMKKDALILLIMTGVLGAAAYNASVITEARLPGLEVVVGTEIEDDTEGLSVPELSEDTEEIAETETIISTEIAGTEAVMEVETETADYVMYSSKWDEVRMNFYLDGTCVFEMPDYKIEEACTWTYADGVLSVTRSDGVVFTSYIAEDTVALRLDYHALKHDQLIGQFDSTDYKTFFGE